MNSNEMARLRRQMQRRIREVVAERRISRQENPMRNDGDEIASLTVDSAS